MPTGQLTSPLYQQIEVAAIGAYVERGPYTQRAIAARIAAMTGEDAQRLAQRLPQFLKKLAKRGHYVSQPAAFGSKAGLPGGLTSPRAFNWSSLPLDAAVLREAAAAFLADDRIEPTRKSALRSALRLVLELPTKCDDSVILTACERVAPDEVYDLAQRASDTAIARNLDKQTAKNASTAIRGAIRWAAQLRLIPIVFPPLRVESDWTGLKNEYLPLAAVGPTDNPIVGFRSKWVYFERTARELFGENVQFAEITREKGEQIIAHLLLATRQGAAGYGVRQLFRHIADSHGTGPFAEESPLDRFVDMTPAGLRPSLYLRGPNGEAADCNWDDFFALLERLGFPVSLIEFLRWYRQYVTMPALDILDHPDFPLRRQRHLITEKTSFARLEALRGFLGAAVYRLEVGPDGEHVGLEMPAECLTPDVLFGSRFQQIVRVMIRWWQARAAHLPDGAIGKATSGSLRQMVINGGMIALGYYEWLRHQRGLQTATRVSPGGQDGIDSAAEEGAEKTAAETAAWDAYQFAGAAADALADLTKDVKGRSRKRRNEFRDIRRILEITPPSFWITLQNGLIGLIREAREKGEDDEYEYHALVLDAVVLGLLISTGCRIEELCLLRLDVQFSQAKRLIQLRAIDRKNDKAHTALIQEAYLPDDILEEYLHRSRPWFMAGCPVPPTTDRSRYARGGKKKRPLVPPHQFVMVSTSGWPFACLSETRNGTNRDEALLKRRTAQLGRRFQTQMAKTARRLKLKLPNTKFEFGPHAVRGACGFGIFLLFDEKAAAQYLGDTIGTALSAYSAIDGSHIDSSCLVGFRVAASSSPGPAGGNYGSKLSALIEAFNDGVITREELDEAKAALKVTRKAKDMMTV